MPAYVQARERSLIVYFAHLNDIQLVAHNINDNCSKQAQAPSLTAIMFISSIRIIMSVELMVTSMN